MNLKKLFRSRFKQEAEISNKYLDIRKESFFLDAEKQAHFIKHGWCTIKDVITKEEIDSFLSTFDEISKLEGFDMDKNLLNSGRLFNPEIRRKTKDVVNKNARTVLPRMFDMSKVDSHTGGAYQVKPAHPESDLMTHQDSTVIDEEKDYCLFVWIPFCDITMENGHIKTLDGSHLWGNTQRSLGVPWQFRNNIDTLNKYMDPVLVNAGDVMVFDPALIHSSSPNYTDKVRHAITITVLRKDYQLVYYFINKELEDGLIEKYYVDEDFYLDYDFISKPDESKWRKEVVPYKDFELSNKKIIKLIKKHDPKWQQ